MNRYFKVLIIIALINLYPFGCDGQTIIDPDCSDLVSEQWEAERNAFQDELARLNGSNQQKTDSLRAYETDILRLGDILEADGQKMAQMDQTIKDQEGQIENQALQISTLITEKSDIQSLLDECLARPTEVDTVEVESEFITVAGVQYKVSDIELIRPVQELDTISIGFCKDVTGERDFVHEGPIDEYPHFINIASKTKGMIKVYFETPLDSTIKVADEWEVLRIRNYELARTQYNFIRAK